MIGKEVSYHNTNSKLLNMKKLLVLLICLFVTQLSFGQLSNATKNKLKIKLMNAEELYENKEYNASLDKLSEINSLLNGKTYPTILNLEIKNLVALEKYTNAKEKLNKLETFNLRENILTDIASYTNKIDEGVAIETRKKEEELKRLEEERIKQVEKRLKQIERQKKEKEDHESWKIALELNSIDGFRQYNYKSELDLHRKESYRKIEELKNIELIRKGWEKVVKSNNIKELKKFRKKLNYSAKKIPDGFDIEYYKNYVNKSIALKLLSPNPKQLITDIFDDTYKFVDAEHFIFLPENKVEIVQSLANSFRYPVKNYIVRTIRFSLNDIINVAQSDNSVNGDSKLYLKIASCNIEDFHMTRKRPGKYSKKLKKHTEYNFEYLSRKLSSSNYDCFEGGVVDNAKAVRSCSRKIVEAFKIILKEHHVENVKFISFFNDNSESESFKSYDITRYDALKIKYLPINNVSVIHKFTVGRSSFNREIRQDLDNHIFPIIKQTKEGRFHWIYIQGLEKYGSLNKDGLKYARARAIKNYFTELGFPKERISITSGNDYENGEFVVSYGAY